MPDDQQQQQQQGDQQQQQQQQQGDQQQQQQQPWYHGKVDAEIIGHWDNKGWKKDDPAAVAIEATKAARELQKHFGVPAEQLIKLPKDLSDADGMKPVYARLGVPAEPKEYDFSTVKFGGQDLETGFADKMRAALHSAAVRKDAGPAVVKAVVEYLEAADAAEAAEATARKQTGIARLKDNWGKAGMNAAINEARALEGANRLGLNQQQYEKICDAIGWDVGPELMRKIGVGTTEDTFHEGGTGGSHSPTTVQGAQARLAELQANPEWAAKLISKNEGSAEKREFANLMAIISGAA